MENIKSSSTTDRYTATSRSNLRTFLHDHRQVTFHSHRQPSTPVIGMNPSPLLDLAISCLSPIGTNLHWQLFCRPATTFLSADLCFQGYVSKNGVNACPPISEYKIFNAPKFFLVMMHFRNYPFLPAINYQIQTTLARFSCTLPESLNSSNQISQTHVYLQHFC